MTRPVVRFEIRGKDPQRLAEFYRELFGWNVDGAKDIVTLTMSGLDESNKQFQKVKVLEVRSGIPLLDFDGRWGFASATATATQHTEVLAARVESPMVAP